MVISFNKTILDLSGSLLGAHVSYSSLYFSPWEFPWTLDVRDVKAKGENPWVESERVSLILDVSRIFKGIIRFSSADLWSPKWNLRRMDTGGFNFSDFSLSPVIKIHNGTFSFSDQTVESSPVLFTMTEIEGQIIEDDQSNIVPIKVSGNFIGGPEGERLKIPVIFDGEYVPAQDAASFNIKLGSDQEIEFDGEAIAVTSEMGFRGKLAVRKLALEKWSDGGSGTQNEFIRGILTADLELDGKGYHAESLKRYLGAAGSLDIREGSLDGVNFVKDILGQMTPIKGFDGILKEPLEDDFRALLDRPDTPFNIMKANIQFVRGRFIADEIVVQNPNFVIQADGSFSAIERDVDFRAKLVLMPKFSSFLAERGKSLLLMQNKEGRVVIPFIYRGLLPGAMTYPDLSLLTNSNPDKTASSSKKESYLNEKTV